MSEAQHKEEETYLMSQQAAVTLFLKKVDLNDLKLCLAFHYNITGRSQRQVLFFQWQGIGPARAWRSAATGHTPSSIIYFVKVRSISIGL